MKNFIQNGKVMAVTAGAGGIVSGAVVKTGSLIGIATNSAAETEICSVSLTGVYESKKKTTDVVAQGAPLYWDATNSELTVTASGNTLAGYAFAAAGSGETTAQLKLLF